MPKNTSGKFHKEDNGTWTIDTKIKVNDRWVHLKKRGFATLGDAKAKYHEIEQEHYNKQIIKDKNYSIEKIYNEYIKNRSYQINFTSLEKDISLIKCHILPYYSKIAPEEIFTQEQTENWYHFVLDSTLSNTRKQQIVAKMKDMLKFAYTHKYINAEMYQDCDVILLPVSSKKESKVERVIWTADEEKQFLAAVKDKGNDKDYLYFKIILNTGLRMGEYLGLQGKCFDHDKRILKIEQQVVNKDGDGWILTTKLKTSESYRNVVLPADLCEEIESFIKDFNIGNDDFIIFSTNKKKPLSRTEFRRRLEKYCELAKVRKLNPHALRHNQAVKLSKVCVTMDDIENAAKRLGHSPSMFADTYAKHQNEVKQNELLERMYRNNC